MMVERKLAVVFGGSGFLGRYVVRRLAARGYVVRVAVRDVESAMILRPMGDVGQIVPLYAPVTEEALVARATEGAEIVVNLAGILNERRRGDFFAVHADGAGRIARLAAGSVARHLVHVSALGADAASGSEYARSKAEGEAAVRAAFPGAAILRPSILFGAEDQFFNKFASLAAVTPVIPIVHGATKLQPAYVADVADAVVAALAPAARGRIYELGGPDVASFRALIELTLRLIGRNRWIWDMGEGLARLQAAVLERLPGKLLTVDQVKLLRADNVVAAGAAGFPALGLTPATLELILPAYLARYRLPGREGWVYPD